MDNATKTEQKATSSEAPAAADKRDSPKKVDASVNMANQQQKESQQEFRLGEQGLLQIKKKINVNAPVFSPTSFPLGPLGESIPGYDDAPAKKKKKKSKKKKQATEDSAPAEAAKDDNEEDHKGEDGDRVENSEEKKEMVWVVKDKTKQPKKAANVVKGKDSNTPANEKSSAPTIEVQAPDKKEDEEKKLKKEEDKKAAENPEAVRTVLAWEAKEERRVAFKPEQSDLDQAAEESKFLTPGNRSSQGRNQRRDGGRSSSNKGRRDSSNKNERKAQFKIISRGRGQRDGKPIRGGFSGASSSSAKSSRSNSVRGNSANRQTSGIVGGQVQPGFTYKPVGAVKSFDPLGGYKPPFKVRERSRHHSNMVDALEAEENKLPKNSYSLEFVFGLKQNNKQRPMNMAELDFPSKKKVSTRQRKNPLTEKDKFNKFVGDIRILLNKLSTNNFDTISQRLLNNFQYTPSLLYELMKMIFLKSTLEHAYLDVYVRLCTLLFKRFKDDENHELNFKKLLINKCQSQFYKMLKKKEEKRRRESLEIEGAGKEEVKDVDGDYSIPMMMLYDDQEMEERKKEQMLGNMYLITELHVAKQLSGSIIKACIDDLQLEINDQNVEILCYMVSRLMVHLCKVEMAINESEDKKTQRRSSLKEINLIFCDKILQWLFQYRHDTVLTSRTRFKIQDLIDAYNEEWKQFITLFKARDAKDESKPVTAYVPKNQILTEHQVFVRGGSRKSSGSANIKGYFYRPKSSSNEFQQEAKPAFGKGGMPKPGELATLFSALKADDDVRLREAGRSSDEDSEDEDVGKLVGRRISMNQDNKTGQDFESHLAHGPGEGVLREIQNMFNEYRESENKEHAKEELSEICDKHSIPRHQFVGYFLSNSLSEKPEDFRHLMNLVFEYFYLDQKLVDSKQMKDSINVCVANLPDLTIDYPNARAYATEMLQKAKELKVIDADSAALYVSHVENMNDMGASDSD